MAQALLTVFLIMTFLEGYKIFQITFSKLAAVPLMLLALRVGITSEQLRSVLIVTLFLILNILISAGTGSSLAEIMKSAAGSFVFFLTIIFLPRPLDLLYDAARRSALPFLFPFIIYFGAFLLDAVIGLNRQAVVYGSPFRPHGIAGEPSWLAVSLTALACLIYSYRSSIKFVTAAALLVIGTGSSSGLLLGVILLAKPMERNDLFNLSNILIPAGVGLVALVALLVSGSLQDLFLPLLDKLANPFAYASGVNRLLRPLPYVIQVLNEAPFFGMGFNYFEERILNNAAGASLFLAVFWELGLVGVGFYLYMLIRLGVSQSPPLTSLALAATCLVTVGLPYSTMQATAMVLMLFTAKGARRREDQPRRPEAAEQP